ncbi:hypothetical protein BH11PLA2_BH11PLA2_50170 [soil metagenome]
MRSIAVCQVVAFFIGVPAWAWALPDATPQPLIATEVEPALAAVSTGAWFASTEVAIVRTHVKPYPSNLFQGVTLGTTVSPEFTGGYQFAGGRALHFDYRLLNSSGSRDYAPQAQVIGLGPNDEILTSYRPYRGSASLNLQTFDLDFTFRDPPWEILPFIRSRWEIGARAMILSSEVREPKTFDDRFGISMTQATEWFGDEKLTSKYQGYGPHFDYKLAIAAESLGLEFFALSDVAVLFGTRTARYSPVDPQPRQNGREVGPGWSFDSQNVALVGARPISEHSFACTAWNWRGDLGAKFSRPWRDRLMTLSAGYRMDFWSFGGQSFGGTGFFSGAVKVPDLNLDVKGAFLRFELLF